jgi:hypothetical protein
MSAIYGTKTFDLLVELVRSIRPGWDIAGIKTAIRSSLAREAQPTIAELAYALIRCAENPTVTTPGFVALDGPHWNKAQPKETEPARVRKCQRCSQLHYPNEPCEPVKVRSGRHSSHIAEARTILRDTKARLCRHGVPTWCCHDCPIPTTDVPLPDVPLPDMEA